MEPTPEIDLTRIDFPSDALTIKVLRQRHPDQVDVFKPRTEIFQDVGGGCAGDNMNTMLMMERHVAISAFQRARNLYDPYGGEQIEMDKEGLPGLYEEYGLATGQHHAEQLIRNIESQAVAQARERDGKTP